jgi:PAS domain S-box-containing protein
MAYQAEMTDRIDVQPHEFHFRRLAEEAPDIIYRYRLWPEPGFDYVNAGVTALTGYSPEDHYADPQLGMKLIHPDDRECFARMMQELGDTARLRFVVRWVCRDGHILHTEHHCVLVRDEEGRIVAVEGIARDISAQKELEEALRAQEAKLAALLGNTEDRIWAIDRNYCLIVANRLFCQEVRKAFGHAPLPGDSMFGYSQDAALDDEWKHYYDRALAGEEFHIEVRTVFAPVARFREYRFSSIRNGDGAIEGVVIAGRDTTERKQAEEALRVNLTKYAVIFDSSPMGISITDDKGQILESNREAERLLGVPKAEHERRTYDAPEWRIVRPDGTPMSAAEYASVRALAEQRQVEGVEMGIVKGPDEVTWISVSAAPIPLPGYGVAIAYTDVTERKQAEEALRRSEALFRTLTQLVPVGLYLTDAEGRCQFVNEKWQEMAGMRLEEAVGDGWFQSVHPEDRALLAAKWKEMADARGKWGLEFRLKTPQGKTTWVLGLATELLDASGRLAGYVGANMDISERRAREAEILRLNATLEARVVARTADLEATNAALERAARVKDEFLATMSHELRTPLAGILSMTEALEEEVYGPVTDRQRKSLANIDSSGRHLLELINGILELTRVDAGHSELNLSAFDVEAVCHASLKLVSELAAKKRQMLDLCLAPSRMQLVADYRRIEQILVNLLGNAVKFTPEGGSIHLQVAGDTLRRTITFSVRDTGIGIAAEQISRIFDPFVQLESGLDRHYGGTGLGLALVRRFAELHGGHVEVESTPGAGSCFHVSIPWRMGE